jgi:hypothetical protein
LSQSLHFQTGAKQREQAAYEYDSAFGRQQDIEIPLQSGKMPENDDSEQSAAENKTETPEKQENMIQEQVRTPKRYWHVQNPAPVRDLHHAENTKDHDIGVNVFCKLFSWIEQQLLELGQFLPNKYYHSCYLRREQEQIGYIFGHSRFGFMDTSLSDGETIRPLGGQDYSAYCVLLPFRRR